MATQNDAILKIYNAWLALGTISTKQSVPTESKQDSSKNNPNNTDQWTTDIPAYTIGSSEQISPQNIQKKKF